MGKRAKGQGSVWSYRPARLIARQLVRGHNLSAQIAQPCSCPRAAGEHHAEEQLAQKSKGV